MAETNTIAMKFVHYKLLITIVMIFFGSQVAEGQTPALLPVPYSGPVNYVRVWETVKPYINVADVINVARTTKEVRQTTQYFDGLGRQIQTVVKNGSLDNTTSSPVQTDFVMPVVYDAFGREQFKYLPYAASTATDGNFKSNPFPEQVGFYDNQLGGQPAEVNVNGTGRNWAYSKTNFEASPLNRVTEAYASGASWVGSEGSSTPHPVKMKYWLNTTIDAVRIWTVVDATNGGLGAYTTGATTGDNDGIYNPGELYKNANEDEHGKQVIEYKDKEGKVILKKVQLTAAAETNGAGSDYTGWICTYYIYDDLNNLRAVVQPEGVKALISNGWSFNSTILDEQTFRYEYDHRNRMIMKKVPGAGEVYMVYDARDRLVMTQDANMRTNGKWMVTLYDALNRPVETGLVLNSWFGTNKTFAQHRTDAGSSTSYPFTSGGYPIDPNWEELTKTAYDTYSTLPSVGLSATYLSTWDTNFSATNNNDYPYPQMPAQSNAVKGMATWTRVKVLNSTSDFIYTVMIYDDKGRVIQTQTKNDVTGGVDVVTTQYSWAGQPLVIVQKQQITGTNAQIHTLITKLEYDELGRVKEIKKKINTDAERTLVKNEYDKLGQLKNKKLATYYSGGAIETLNYDYNIRGWMLGMNRTHLEDYSNKFGFELSYDKKQSAFDGNSANTYTNAWYNGNIAGMMWRSVGDGEVRKYDFDYDAMNRLTKADFTQYNSGWNVSAGIDFSVGGSATNNNRIAYDDNGNIKEMWQKGLKIGSSDWIDKMSYTYFAGTNKLQAVTDGITTENKLGDFFDKHNGAIDYGYDKNGNMVTDKNKDLGATTGLDLTSGGAITYNHLNLPQTITVSGKGTITYTYDAAGNKLQKKVTEDPTTANGNTSTVTTTDYVGGFVYETKVVNSSALYTNKLQFGGHEEGRIRALYDNVNSLHILTGFAYDYMLKDHLGNVRMVLTDEVKPASVYQATMETTNRANEVQLFTKIPETESVKPNSGFDTDGNNQTVSKLFNSSGSDKRVGPGVVLKVMAGDKFKARTFGWYLPNETNFDPLSGATSIVSSLVAAFTGGVPAGGSHSGTQLSSSGILDPSMGGFLTNQSNQTAVNRPRAYLNWMILDEEQFQLVNGNYGVVQVPEITGTMGKQLMQANGGNDIEVKKNGYLYVYVSNESQGSVYFDDIRIEHTKGSLIEETHYYPFGLTMAGISSKAVGILQNRKKYNGIEFENDLDINTYDAFFRELDPQIGRWWQVDPKTEDMEQWSQYASNYDNPVRYNDPLGDTPGDGDGDGEDPPKKGFVSSVTSGFVNRAQGFWNAVTHPVETVKSMATIENVKSHMLNTITLGLNSSYQDFKVIKNEGVNGLGRLLGERAFDASVAVVTTKGADFLGKGFATLNQFAATRYLSSTGNLSAFSKVDGFSLRLGIKDFVYHKSLPAAQNTPWSTPISFSSPAKAYNGLALGYKGSTNFAQMKFSVLNVGVFVKGVAKAQGTTLGGATQLLQTPLSLGMKVKKLGFSF